MRPCMAGQHPRARALHRERGGKLCDGATIEAAQLSLPAARAATIDRLRGDAYVPRPLADVEREHILTTVQVFGGNRSEAARALGIGRNTLLRKLKEYGET